MEGIYKFPLGEIDSRIEVIQMDDTDFHICKRRVQGLREVLKLRYMSFDPVRGEFYCEGCFAVLSFAKGAALILAEQTQT
jgi:hypothetical protein